MFPRTSRSAKTSLVMWKFNCLSQCRRLLNASGSVSDRELVLKSKKELFIFRNQSTTPDSSSNFYGGPGRYQRSQRYQNRSTSVGDVALLIIPIGCFALGCWQVKRKKWKEDLLEKIEYQTTLVPVNLPEDLSNIQEWDYRPVRVKGTFDHSREVFLGPRSLLLNGAAVSQNTGLLSTQDANKTGYLVITPFKLSDRDVSILVNRGWVPSSKRDPRTRFAGQVEGEVELEGIIRTAERRAPFMKENRNPHLWTYRDIEKMAQVLQTSPIFIDAKVESSVPGGPIGGQTKVDLWNEHFTYILTWYSLAIGTGYAWYKNYLKKV